MQRKIQEIIFYYAYFSPEYLGVGIVLLKNFSRYNRALENNGFILIY